MGKGILGALAFGDGVRINQAFLFVTKFAMWILLWTVAVWVIEFFVNGLIMMLVPVANRVFIDLPTPLELIDQALLKFPNFWAIGTTLFWGLMEELMFFGGIIFAVIGVLTGAVVFTNLSDKLMIFSDRAGAK
ncbi:MAG: hypothetical protein KAS32_07440 [Candidatus Peribacteraceae bacterium]|nr:hypothetical protein [Candidatus Peribacteraceae bacterium]